MKARQFDIISGRTIADPGNLEKESKQNTSPKKITNPCIGCDLKEWCSDDDCAKKCYPIDLPTTRFKNLNEMITYFRTHDLLGL